MYHVIEQLRGQREFFMYGEEENTYSELDSPGAGAGYLINRNISGAKRRFRFTYLEAEGAAEWKRISTDAAIIHTDGTFWFLVSTMAFCVF